MNPQSKQKRIAFGYMRLANNQIAIHEGQAAALKLIYGLYAEVIRMIYAWHSQGLSLRSISAHLQEQNILSPHGKPKWGIETIRKILQNEKYRGDVLLQKTFVADFFTGRQTPNKGEYAKYLITEHHEAIIE